MHIPHWPIRGLKLKYHVKLHQIYKENENCGKTMNNGA